MGNARWQRAVEAWVPARPLSLADGAVSRPAIGSPLASSSGETPPSGVGFALASGGTTLLATAGWAGVTSVAGLAGLANVAGGSGAGSAAESLTAWTSHDLASVTKVMSTTTLLLRLVSQGLVGLEDAVQRYLPGFSSVGADRVTIEDLLLHRGGLWEWQPLYATVDTSTHGRKAALAVAESMPLRYAPGVERHYSDLGFMVLGEVVETVTGMPLEQAFDNLVATPLGLEFTRYGTPVPGSVATSSWDDRIERTMVATGQPYPVLPGTAEFSRWRTEPVTGQVSDGNAFHALGGVSGHAGLFSTLGDMLRWGLALAQYEHHEDWWNPQVARGFFAAGPDAEQALGFRRYELDTPDGPRTLLGHPGFIGCAVGFIPGSDIALALVSNRLLTAGQPMPTATLWEALLKAAAIELHSGHHDTHPSQNPSQNKDDQP
ncbi:serine hydrolase domain-containing protein [Psychromicrobium xiongbiense]|uniref:serine hydrolase domain-containing protein n=1 Tax=Psychromicrobium xiongbiense TaxID=3051184 RepID=UPI002554AEC7|nr:serine hydrolase domain-containing protein [Psychromicrobium sp. YIM S02556]